MKLKDKIIYVVVFMAIISFFAIIIINQYKYTKIQKNDLTVVSEVYVSCKKTRHNYKITCESDKEYLITFILVDDEQISKINPGDSIVLGVDKNTIIELEVNGKVIVSIEDCHQKYNKQIKTSLIACSLFIGFIGLFLLGLKLLQKRIDSKYDLKIKINNNIDEKVYESIQNSIYKKNGCLRCYILEQIESDELIYTFYKAIIDYLDDKELILLIEDSCLNDELAMIFYRDKDKLYFNQIFRTGENPFKIECDLFWFYPLNAKVTKEEQIIFRKILNTYIEENSELLQLIK